MTARRIMTSYSAKPVPSRQFDWVASFEGDEPDDNGNMTVGYGSTEQEAIADLIEAIDDQSEYDAQIASVRLAVAQ